jgi:hypothetical protein
VPAKAHTGPAAARDALAAQLAEGGKKLADGVSDRADVVLLGPALAERAVGGAKTRTILKTWRQSFILSGKVRGGLSASKTVAWASAIVNAEIPRTKLAIPMRVFAVYERKGDAWTLVLAHWSVALD